MVMHLLTPIGKEHILVRIQLAGLNFQRNLKKFEISCLQRQQIKIQWLHQLGIQRM
jgi:hypothetical protein